MTMKQTLRTIFFALLVGTGGSLLAQSQSNEAVPLKSQFESNGINYDQVLSITEQIIGSNNDVSPALLTSMLRNITIIKDQGSPMPMSDELLNDWMVDFEMTNEQAQDLYKVIIRFALQNDRR